MNRLPAGLRTSLYMTAFVLSLGVVAALARNLDPRLGWIPPVWLRPLGLAGILSGAALSLSCALLFVFRGRGTPFSFDPPREFVVTGPYRYIRNPMYVAGGAILAGFGLALQSPAILLLTASFLVAAHCFVVFVEEPVLERRFGASYSRYKRAVGRWLPTPSRANRPTAAEASGEREVGG